MKELILTDVDGKELIIRYRKSAVFFLRKGNPMNTHEHKVSRDKDLVQREWNRIEMFETYRFNASSFAQVVQQLLDIAKTSWSSFEPKVADSLGADHDEYYDPDFDSNGSAAVRGLAISFDGPWQTVSSDHLVRLYKFNKRKFESFLFDCIEQLEKVGG